MSDMACVVSALGYDQAMPIKSESSDGDAMPSYYALRTPALNGETVTQGDVDYCAANGHMTHVRDGALSLYCPRCDARIGHATLNGSPVDVEESFTYVEEDTMTNRDSLLSTDQLRKGMIVHSHGMVIRLDCEPRVYVDNHNPMGRTVYAFDGLVLNPADVADDSALSYWLKEDNGRWTIQGNDLATWSVETVSLVKAYAPAPIMVKGSGYGDSVELNMFRHARRNDLKNCVPRCSAPLVSLS